MEYKDYYQTLGVSKTATEKEIKSAFRKLAQKFHPDRNLGDKTAEERFKAINEAYEVLSDAEKRAKYDQLGSSYAQWEQMGRPGGGFDFGQWAAGMGGGAAGNRRGNVHVEYQNLDDLFGDSSFSDFFETLFGGSLGRSARSPRSGGTTRTPPRPARSQNIEQPVEITLEEAYHGTTRVLQRGSVRKEFKIPPGAKTGTKIRFAGGGSTLEDSASGDLFLVVNVLPHSIYRREGDDLHADLPVDAYTAMLGGEVPVPTLGGEVVLTIPPETQAGKTFRLSGRGLPKLRQADGPGDLYVHVVIKIPTHLTQAERKLIAELAALRTAGQ
jgi:curved DNA-binding protein